MTSWKIGKGCGTGVPNILDRLYISETELVAHRQAMGVPWPPFQDSPAMTFTLIKVGINAVFFAPYSRGGIPVGTGWFP